LGLFGNVVDDYCFVLNFIFCASGGPFSLNDQRKGGKESRRCAGLLMGFSVFMGGGHPHLPAQFPPFRVCYTPLPLTPNITAPTAQRPTPPANRIQVFRFTFLLLP
jgi:hypothetical protein